MKNKLPVLGFALLCLIGHPVIGYAEEKKPEPATIQVSGLGWFNNRTMRLSLDRLLGEDRGATLGSNAIEDAAVILLSSLGEDGYQRPQLELVLTQPDKTEQRIRFDPTFATMLPRSLSAQRVRFEVKEGVRWRVTKVQIEGLTVLPPADGEDFFRPGRATLLTLDDGSVYSPSKLNRAADALAAELRLRGYAESTVRATAVKTDEATGDVEIKVIVQEGPRWEVKHLAFAGAEDGKVKLPVEAGWVDRPWNSSWQEDLKEVMRQQYYRSGFPDVDIVVEPKAAGVVDNVKPITAVTTIKSGPSVTVGEVKIEGAVHTKESVLRRRIRLDPGEPLNPLRAERARYRLSRLGVFQRVDVRYEDVGDNVRSPVFTLREGPRYDLSLLAGYGSYEQLRGGVEVRQMNLWGRAHQTVFELIQSMKSTRGEYSYTVPELFGENVDVTTKLFGLRREEVAFLRQEYGANLTLQRRLPWLHSVASVGYAYESLSNRDSQLGTRGTDSEEINVASITFGLTSDRRDNPLQPRRGYRWYAQAELADPSLGGSAYYQRFELGAAYHTAWGKGRWIHAGLAHGAVTTFGSNDKRLPVNRRFYPGGSNSIRGFNDGEAAPRDADGFFIGAKTYLSLNLELEQALSKSWSIVVFGDALGESASMAEYPFDEELYSVGLGLRYQTLIGPVRVEYGHNLNPRRDDPRGTLQLSVGYPF